VAKNSISSHEKNKRLIHYRFPFQVESRIDAELNLASASGRLRQVESLKIVPGDWLLSIEQQTVV
jgi:hypothetical protein